MTNTNTTTEITNAQLFWDSQDRNNTGWCLRFRDGHGTETSYAIDGDEDESTETLAALVAAAFDAPVTGKVTVYRHEEKRGSITLVDGEVSTWRAL